MRPHLWPQWSDKEKARATEVYNGVLNACREATKRGYRLTTASWRRVGVGGLKDSFCPLACVADLPGAMGYLPTPDEIFKRLNPKLDIDNNALSGIIRGIDRGHYDQPWEQIGRDIRDQLVKEGLLASHLTGLA